MEKILISACLMGQKVNYRGDDAFCDSELLAKWKQEQRLVIICPEVSAGMSVPRPACEIVGEGGGSAVLNGTAKVISNEGIDTTDLYIEGANNALALAKKERVKLAILKARSPSCGNNNIYDGTHIGKLIPGMGVTVALLRKNGIAVFNESQIQDAAAFLSQLESV